MSANEALARRIAELLDPSSLEEPGLITYPASGSTSGLRRSSLASGIYTFDFLAGTVTLPGGTSEKMSSSLTTLRAKAVRSLALYFAPFETSIIFFQNQNPQTQADSCSAWHFYNNVNITKLQAVIPGGLIPDAQNDMQLLASNKPYFPYYAFPGTLPHVHLRAKANNSTDAYVTYLLTHTISNHAIVVKILNKAAANGLTVTFQSVESPTQPLDSDTDWVTEVGFPQNIAAGNGLIIDLSGARHFIRLQAKSQVGGASASFDWEFMGHQ